MYGLLIENISQFIQERYSVDKWNEIRRLAHIEEITFNTHTIYPDVYTKNIINKACQVLKLTEKQFLIEVGESFVIFISRYGYDIILSALGREFGDFLNSLDDLHEYLRLSYPRLRPPSYFCENENEQGLILHYRTKRNFLLWYTVGQIITVAKVFYSTDVEIELLRENQEINEYHFILQLRFNNRAYLQRLQANLTRSYQTNNHERLSPTSPMYTSMASLFGCPAVANVMPKSASSCPYRANSSESLQRCISPIIPSINPANSINLDYKLPPISLETFLDIFPFTIIYDQSMTIRQTGSCLKIVCSNIINQKVTKLFSLIKPKIELTWDSILRHTNTTFELRLAILLKNQNKNRRIISELKGYNIKHFTSIQEEDGYDLEANHFLENVNKNRDGDGTRGVGDGGTLGSENDDRESSGSADSSSSSNSSNNGSSLFLQLKGQMMYFESWKCVAFLGAPNVSNLDTLIKTGLYLNDLSMHDFSRDMVLVGQQQSAELKLALDQELHKSRQLEITIKKLDEERRRSDELLYQMYIPKKIADKLRIGEKNIETCQYFPSVTILFSDIINFTEICSKIAPMQVVNMLNETYTKFDQLLERHNIYKVETIGDAYMVAGGLPVHQEESSYSHARKVCLMAMDMIDAVYHIRDPSCGRHLKIRIGIHTGPVVGGIVGQKMPRYCLFGDTVNTSSRMETSSVKMRVQISEVTQRLLDLNEWEIRERGTIRLKGKGMMKTFWLKSKQSANRMHAIHLGQGRNSDSSTHQGLIATSGELLASSNSVINGSLNGEQPANQGQSRIRKAFFPLSRRNDIHDSNYSLFVRNRIKFSCLII